MKYILLIVTLASVVLAGCTESLHKASTQPTLLKGVTAGSGWGTPCPPRNEQEQKIIEASGKLAISPELQQRLQSEFPPGTSEDRVIAALISQGFKLEPSCATDKTIQRASFFQAGTVILPTDIAADIYWKLDGQRRIVWTKGFVMFIGL